VSPGVYTSEKDLTFVAQSVGVTTLGLVGETLKGPAFEPVLITSYDEFRNYFGYSSPLKDGNGNPKYELPYVAKSYLQESNQLFVTRVLGLTGYKPVISIGIKTLGGITVDKDTIITGTTGSTIVSGGTYVGDFEAELSGKTAHDGTSITDYIATNYSGFTVLDDGKWFVIGKPDADDVVLLTGTLEEESPLTGGYNANANNEKEWYNVFYHMSGATDTTIDAVYSYLFVYNSGSTSFDITRYTYEASLNTDYSDQIVAELRPRGRYVGQELQLEVTGGTQVALSQSGSNDITINALSDFILSVSGETDGAKTFTCSLDNTSTKYISKVLGTSVFDKSYKNFPIFVNEIYPNFLNEAFMKGYVRGLSLETSTKSQGNNFVKEWDTPSSPMVVSEVRGGEVDDLFEILTISDGESANFEIKVTFANINVDTAEFDVMVRDFNDTDDNMVVLEKFSRCSMNPNLPGYVAKKIGTSDTEYELRSKYIMLNMAVNAPVDAFPAGFKGLTTNATHTSGELGSIIYKTQYNVAGDVTGYQADGTPIISSGDKIRKVMLGMSSDLGFDMDLLKFKGEDGATVTKGFHLSSNAPSGYTGTIYNLEGVDKGLLNDYRYRKFTMPVFGGFDGWDVYRQVRTNTDGYIFGKNTYISGNTTNGGVFNAVNGNSDYYAYLAGIDTFANPEAVDINLFATPGLDFYNHSSLVNYTIDMIETDRADSLYVINSPNRTTADEIIDDIDFVGLDTNYSATYWPWVQIRDEDNATQLYIPPTGEVLRNFALTDNVSYPWFATAGYSRGLVKSIKAVKKLTLSERDDLYKNRINPIATFSDTGTIIWGNKTLQIRESALDRLSVRRLLLRTRKLISAVSVRLLFEQNDEQVRNEFLRLVNPILDAIKKERGLYEFKVVVSNDPEDIDANTLRGKIYIKPTRALEFIDLEFIITPTGASFENI
jgi:hypothetical protein